MKTNTAQASAPLLRLDLAGYNLRQVGAGVQVQRPDGSAVTIIGRRLTRDAAPAILEAMARPADFRGRVFEGGLTR